MTDSQICPWCQSEIVWDEEIGPEEYCPHCLNPLQDYRSVTLELERNDTDEEAPGGMPGRPMPPPGLAGTGKPPLKLVKPEGGTSVPPQSPSGAGSAGGPQGGILDADYDGEGDLWDDDAGEARQTPERRMLARYLDKAKRYVDTQLEAPECFACRELMVHAGEWKVDKASFSPQLAPGMPRAFLTAPFAADLYICPACFQMQTRLAAGDRRKLVERLGADE